MSQTAPEIFVSDYDSEWPGRYAEEAALLSQALAVMSPELHHIGSTAVPGLAAKPLIDVMAAVDRLREPEDYLLLVGPLGYHHVAVPDPGRLLFIKGAPRSHHIHITERDGWHYWRFLLFRDHLRASREAACAYEVLKRTSARLYAHNREEYTCSKTEFITATVVEILRDYPDLAARLKAGGAPLP